MKLSQSRLATVFCSAIIAPISTAKKINLLCDAIVRATPLANDWDWKWSVVVPAFGLGSGNIVSKDS